MGTIQQIMPAEGWYAIYDMGKDGMLAEPLAAFAVVEYEKGRRAIAGYSGQNEKEITEVKGIVNFVAFSHESELYKWISNV